MNTGKLPFNWNTPVTGDTPSLLISAFPSADADAGLAAAASKITLEAKAMAW
jgi:hypothetical protein